MPVERLIRDSAAFALRGSNVRSEFSFAADLWPLELDEGQAMQVSNNILINACQAMPGGGKVMITGENVDIEPKNSLPFLEGKYVKISLEDQGIGISEEHLQKIFDPYFSTKQQGSGLGLAIAHSIIRNHNGYITVRSRQGVGTTFFIYLPASESRSAKTMSEEKKYVGGTGKVLVMDDEEMVRSVAGEMLKNLGLSLSQMVPRQSAYTSQLWTHRDPLTW